MDFQRRKKRQCDPLRNELSFYRQTSHCSMEQVSDAASGKSCLISGKPKILSRHTLEFWYIGLDLSLLMMGNKSWAERKCMSKLTTE